MRKLLRAVGLHSDQSEEKRTTHDAEPLRRALRDDSMGPMAILLLLPLQKHYHSIDSISRLLVTTTWASDVCCTALEGLRSLARDSPRFYLCRGPSTLLAMRVLRLHCQQTLTHNVTDPWLASIDDNQLDLVQFMRPETLDFDIDPQVIQVGIANAIDMTAAACERLLDLNLAVELPKEVDHMLGHLHRLLAQVAPEKAAISITSFLWLYLLIPAAHLEYGRSRWLNHLGIIIAQTLQNAANGSCYSSKEGPIRRLLNPFIALATERIREYMASKIAQWSIEPAHEMRLPVLPLEEEHQLELCAQLRSDITLVAALAAVAESPQDPQAALAAQLLPLFR